MFSVRTVEVCGPHKGDVYTKVAVVRGTVQTQVDAERNRRPSRILLSAVKAYLGRQWRALSLEIQSLPSRSVFHTLFAGFNFNFSNIFSDCCLVARPLILAGCLAGGLGVDRMRVPAGAFTQRKNRNDVVPIATASRGNKGDDVQSKLG